MSDTPARRKKASHGEGTIYWSEAENCFIGEISLGFRPDGSRIRPKVRGRTKTEVRNGFKELKEDHANGIELGDKYTVAQACRDFLARGLPRQDEETVKGIAIHINKHIIPGLGRAKLKRLSADDVDDFLASKKTEVSTSYLGASSEHYGGSSGSHSGATRSHATSPTWSRRRRRRTAARARP